MQAVRSILPQDYAAARATGVEHVLIDVREPWEFSLARIDGAVLMPIGQIEAWATTLDRDAAYVLMCHHGIRSRVACQMLGAMGFRDVTNLDGGIDAWAYSVDPRTPRY